MYPWVKKLDNTSDPNIYSHHNFCNKLYIYKYKIQFIVSWGCVALTPKNSLRISLPLLRIIFNATANIPIIGKIIWEIYMISQAGYFPNWSGDILEKLKGFFLKLNKNCSELMWKKIVLVIRKNFWNSRLKAKYLRSPEQFIQTVKGQNNFGNDAFSTCFSDPIH